MEEGAASRGTRRTRTPAPPRTRTPAQRFALRVFIALVLGVGGGLLLSVGAPHLKAQADLGLFLTICLCMGASYFGVILLHELGHVLGAYLVGFQFVALTVGPIRLYRSSRGLRFGLNRRTSWTGGISVSLPTGNHALARRTAIMVAGGPLASLAVGLYFALQIVRQRYPDVIGSADLLRYLLPRSAAMWAFVTLILTLWPHQIRGLFSDGYQLRVLARGGPKACRWMALRAITAWLYSSQSLRDLPEGPIANAIAIEDGTLESVQAFLFAYYWALIRGETARAMGYLGKAAESRHAAPQRLQRAVILELAYVVACVRRDPVLARRMSPANASVRLPKTATLRVNAAILLAEGSFAQAAEQATQALHLLRRAGPNAATQLEIALVTDLLARAREGIAHSTVAVSAALVDALPESAADRAEAAPSE